ncbi:MAG: hypothetical protein V4850_36560 [Myxococcota bacterium]
MFILPLLMSATQPTLAAPKYRSPDARREWHTARFGASSLEDMTCTPGVATDTKDCTRPAASGDTTIGELKADSVTYRYFEGRLYRVDVAFNTDAQAAALSTVLHQVYGPGAWSAIEQNESWRADQNAVSWTINRRTPGAVLAYTFLPGAEDLEAARVKQGGAALEQTAAAL